MNIKSWVPINGNVLLLDDEKKEKIGSLYVPEGSDGEKLIEGTIVEVSSFLLENGSYTFPPFKGGDRAIYSTFTGAGNVTKSEGRTFRMAKWNEILGIIK